MLHLNWVGEVWLGLLIGSFELSFPMFCHRLDKVNLKCYDTVLKKVDFYQIWYDVVPRPYHHNLNGPSSQFVYQE